MPVEFIIDGRGNGPVSNALFDADFDFGLMRPYLDNNGRGLVTVNTGRIGQDGQPERKPKLITELTANGLVVNGPASLRKDEWVRIDEVVLKAARERLRAWSDLAAASSYGGFNGMSKLVLEHETMSDPGEALVDFDGMTEGRNDSPLFQLQALPLPIIHSGFWFSSRRLAISRNGNTPLDTAMAEAAGRRVAETVEKMTIGTLTGPAYGADSRYGRESKVYGYLNFPPRLTKFDLTVPNGTNPQATVDDVLAMRELLYDNNYFGPYMIYHSTDWDKYLDNDYYVKDTGLGQVSGSNQTLRDRLRAIEGIQDVRRLDFLKSSEHPFTMIMVQMTSEVAQAVTGMGLTTVQWQTMGGMRLNFKVMSIMVPRLRADFYDRTGILHAKAA